jgi:type VI protein secretion system component Hcp
MSIYLKIPNLTGESAATDYKGQFELAALAWNGKLVAQAHGASATDFTSISVSKLVTRHSPELMLLMASQKNIGKIVITLTKPGADSDLPADVYSLDDAVLTGFSQTVDTLSQPTELLTFAFSRATLTQFSYNKYNGNVSEDTHYWNANTNMGH